MNKNFWRGFLDGLAFRPLWRILAAADIAEAILAEREECAIIGGREAEKCIHFPDGQRVADAIRKRSNV